MMERTAIDGKRERERESGWEGTSIARSIKHLIFIRYETRRDETRRDGTRAGGEARLLPRIYIIGSYTASYTVFRYFN